MASTAFMIGAQLARTGSSVGASAAAAAAGRVAARGLATKAVNVGPTQTYLDGCKELRAAGESVRAHIMQNNAAVADKIESLPLIKDQPVLQRVVARESNARAYVRKFPVVLEKGEGMMLTDVNGLQYYDCLACAGTLALGHNHPVTINAMKEFLESGSPMQLMDIATPLKDAFTTKLFEILPDNITRLHHCSPAGTDGIDAAVKLCKNATGRRTVLSFAGGYHGQGQGPMAMMGNYTNKSVVSGLMPDVYFLPYPYTYRNPFGIDGEEGERAVLKYIETMLADDERGFPPPACVVLEAIQGEGGVHNISDFALQEIRRITAENGIPLVLDEVQAGFCRSGDMFAFESAGIKPDVVVMSKALGGSMPMCVIGYSEELDKWGPAAHTGTFRGNQIAFATGLASMNFMTETKLWESVAARGARLEGHLDELQKLYPDFVGNVRGRGLMRGVEVVNPDATTCVGQPVGYGALAHRIQEEVFARGMLMETGGRNGAVCRFLPPLIITDEQVDIVANIFADSVGAAIKALRG